MLSQIGNQASPLKDCHYCNLVAHVNLINVVNPKNYIEINCHLLLVIWDLGSMIRVEIFLMVFILKDILTCLSPFLASIVEHIYSNNMNRERALICRQIRKTL